MTEYQGFNFIAQFLDFAGDDLPFTSEWGYNVDLEYKPVLSNGGSPFIGVAVAGKSGQDTTAGGSDLVIAAGPANRVAPPIVHPLTTNGLYDRRWPDRL